MLRIDCPWCGVRNEDEFSYGGDGLYASKSSRAASRILASCQWLPRLARGRARYRDA
jgi:sarcosine oxidase delta subunit